MTLRISEELTAKLRAVAEREGVSMHTAALNAIDQYVNRRTERRDQIIARIVEEDSGLLRRLADA